MIKLRANHFIKYLVVLGKKIAADDCTGLASEMVYNVIQSLIPAVLFLVALFGLIGGQHLFYPVVIDFITRIAPPHSNSILIALVNVTVQGSSTSLTIIGVLVTLWSASGSGGTIIKGLQRAYGLSKQQFPLWYSPLLCILLFLSLGFILILAMYLILFGDKLIEWLYGYFRFSFDILLILKMVRWMIIAGGITGITAFTYALILRPKTKHLSWSIALPGALFFLLSWVSISWLFGLYIDKMNKFNPVYGTLGALIILVTWLYYSSLIFFVGGEITALRAFESNKA